MYAGSVQSVHQHHLIQMQLDLAIMKL